ncbi:unnamed protein product [Meloidogyne enterolobii]|uniref:Uncharacterized protein n=1 Tax=Meloidogyne enterolobii TaxID=390850 RepID=A0ACB0ZZM6_MELEN
MIMGMMMMNITQTESPVGRASLLGCFIIFEFYGLLYSTDYLDRWLANDIYDWHHIYTNDGDVKLGEEYSIYHCEVSI